MKTTTENLKWLLSGCLLILLLGCSKDDDAINGNPNNNELEIRSGISENDIERYLGEIGLSIDTRPLVKKGYTATLAKVTFNTLETSYNLELDVNPFTNKAQVNLPVENLSESEVNELRNGVSVEIELYNGSEHVTTFSSTALSFSENGTLVNINGSQLNPIYEELYFKEGMPHFMQMVDANGNFSNSVLDKSRSAGSTGTELFDWPSTFEDDNNNDNQQFYFYKYPNSENEYAIWVRQTGRFLAVDANSLKLRQAISYTYSNNFNFDALPTFWRFRIKKESNGLYTIYGWNNQPIRQFMDGNRIRWSTSGNGPIQYVRIVALNINWQSEQLSTVMMPPILPRVETSFGFNSTLVNCGAGSLSQTIGTNDTQSRVFVVTSTEKIGLSSRAQTSIEVGISASAEASFFGAGGSVSASVTAGLELETSVTSETSNTQSSEVGVDVVVTTERTVTVPSGSASLVYDAIQKYSNVKLPYVKRLRLRGNQIVPSTGAIVQSLSGNEIATQLRMSNFTGVITLVGPDFVEISIEGITTLNNFVDSISEVRNVAANCN